MVIQARLKELFDYCPDTGLFTRIIRVNNQVAGTVAGKIHHSGYKYINIDNKSYASHRLAWLYVYGEWPDEIDHINHDRGDNKIKNLRNVTRTENLRNKSIGKNNKSGVIGVTFHKLTGKWQADIRIDKKTEYLGIYNDKFDAICARMSANNKYNFHKNHGGVS